MVFAATACGSGSAGSLCLAPPMHELPQRYESADDAATQEHDQQNEHNAKHQLPGGAEMQRRLKEIAEIQPHGGANQRSEQGAGAADRSLHHELA